ncbi:MAG: Rne/Rng family ribonuclease, partial [Acetobacteraceae bacterium]
PADRRRLKEISAELAVPSGMGLIVRTAGANRPKPEIRRDCEYLLRLWDQIRDTVMNAVAPALIYEEASLIKRAIRDVYSRDVEELLVDGEQGWHAAREFMRTLMPTHARKVQLWKDAAGRSLFSHERVEAELDRILSPTVGLRSGGSLVINQAEALVAIDVNSGRATRERNIEETALRTNLEAAEEAARQLRLRDLAGLIVIDFIDMEVRKHNAMVERRLKEALKSDRARVQVGHISHFGLLEMSRQRLRPSLTETSFSVCPHCDGSGHVRSTESAAIHLLRMLEDEASHRASELRVHVTSAVALYVLNHKRAWLNEIEARHGVSVGFAVDDAEPLSAMRIDRVRGSAAAEPQAAITVAATAVASAAAGEESAAVAASPVEGDQQVGVAAAASPANEAPEEAEDGERHRRRRRRRRRHREEGQQSAAEELPPEFAEQPEVSEASNGEDRDLVHEAHAAPRAGRPERSRRGPRPAQRGGVRREAERPRPADGPATPAPQPDLGYPVGPATVGPTVVGPTVVGPTVVGPTVVGPTPANPFADAALDLFDAIEAAAERAAPPPRQLDPAPPAPDLAAPASDLASPGTTPRPEAPPVDDRPPQPAVRPIVLGTEDAAQKEKKRGWWQR